MEALEERFSQVVSFSDEDIDRACARGKATLVGKFFGKRFPIEFIEKEMRVRWRVEGHFQVSSLLDGILLFDLPSEETQAKILAKGPQSLASQLLALESWHPNFNPSHNEIHQVRI